jgi:hypothetical protein
MFRPLSPKKSADIVVIGCHKPDTWRQLKALMSVFNRKPPHRAEGEPQPSAQHDVQKQQSP